MFTQAIGLAVPLAILIRHISCFKYHLTALRGFRTFYEERFCRICLWQGIYLLLTVQVPREETLIASRRHYRDQLRNETCKYIGIQHKSVRIMLQSSFLGS
jgi:hypothetical protein